MSSIEAYCAKLIENKVVPVIVGFAYNHSYVPHHIPMEELIELSKRISEVASENRYNGPTLGLLVGRCIKNEDMAWRVLDYIRSVSTESRIPSFDDIMRGNAAVRLPSAVWCYLGVAMAYKMRALYRLSVPGDNYMRRMANTLSFFTDYAPSGVTMAFANIVFNEFKLPFDFESPAGQRFRDTNFYHSVFGVATNANYNPSMENSAEVAELASLVVPEAENTDAVEANTGKVTIISEIPNISSDADTPLTYVDEMWEVVYPNRSVPVREA